VIQRSVEHTTLIVQDIALKAQTHLCSGYKTLKARGKLKVQVRNAVARVPADFIWAIGLVNGPWPPAILQLEH
jgi:hypothetical protein